MGVRTLSDFRAELQLSLRERTDLSSHSDLGNLLTVWTNYAYTTLTTKNRFWGRKRNFEFPQLNATDATQSTTDGGAFIRVPTDCISVYHVWDRSNDRKLDNINFLQYVEKTGRASSTDRGQPTFWVRYGDQLYLFKTPDDAYDITIYYRKYPAELDGDDDVTVIGKEWDEIILAIATYQALYKLNELEKAIVFKSEANQLIDELIGIYDVERQDSNDGFYLDPAYMRWDYR